MTSKVVKLTDSELIKISLYIEKIKQGKKTTKSNMLNQAKLILWINRGMIKTSDMRQQESSYNKLMGIIRGATNEDLVDKSINKDEWNKSSKVGQPQGEYFLTKKGQMVADALEQVLS